MVGDRNLNADSAFQIFECIFQVAEQALIGAHIPDLKFQHHIRPLLAVELDTATRRFCAVYRPRLRSDSPPNSELRHTPAN